MATILIVDDEHDVIELVSFLVNQDNHRALTASNGREGVSLALSEKPDLVIMDVMMPEMDGYTATIELARHNETRKIPIIILTAKGNTRDMFTLTPNVAAYIEKPFEPKQLKEKIERALKGKVC